jgi:hypothetical protein
LTIMPRAGKKELQDLQKLIEEDKIVEAMESLRINYNLRQYRVCSLICRCLAEKFMVLAERNRRAK